METTCPRRQLNNHGGTVLLLSDSIVLQNMDFEDENNVR